MIIEDEHGREIDLRDLEDDREPEPPEHDEQPLDLDELAATLADALGDPEPGAATAEILAAVPHLLSRLRAAEEELEDWRGRTHRYEYALTDGTEPTMPLWGLSREEAEDGRQRGRQPWVRTVSVSDWGHLDESPF